MITAVIFRTFMNKIVYLLLVPGCLCFLSCHTQKQIPYYLNNVVDTSGKLTVSVPELKFQKNDIITIQVYSLSTQPGKSDSLYNMPGGYLINGSGDIDYPRLGTIHAEGMTRHQLAAEIRKRLTQPVELLKEPTVIIRLTNFKVTVLGEVNHPGQIPVSGEQINILEAIGITGDATAYARRDAVKVVREMNGVREIGVVDLTSPKLFESSYYYLLQNDVVIVNPTDRKLKQTDAQQVQSRISFALSIASTAALIYSIIRR